jgi:hypothetical protein
MCRETSAILTGKAWSPGAARVNRSYHAAEDLEAKR